MPWFVVSSIYDLVSFDPSLNDFKYLQIIIRVFKIQWTPPLSQQILKDPVCKQVSGGTKYKEIFMISLNFLLSV